MRSVSMGTARLNAECVPVTRAGSGRIASVMKLM